MANPEMSQDEVNKEFEAIARRELSGGREAISLSEAKEVASIVDNLLLYISISASAEAENEVLKKKLQEKPINSATLKLNRSAFLNRDFLESGHDVCKLILIRNSAGESQEEEDFTLFLKSNSEEKPDQEKTYGQLQYTRNIHDTNVSKLKSYNELGDQVDWLDIVKGAEKSIKKKLNISEFELI